MFKEKIYVSFLLMGLVFAEIHFADAASFQSILSMRDRADAIDRLINERLTTLPEQLMRREGIDMWVLVAREYILWEVFSKLVGIRMKNRISGEHLLS